MKDYVRYVRLWKMKNIFNGLSYIYKEDRMLNFIKIETEIPGFANINNNDGKFIFLMTQKKQSSY